MRLYRALRWWWALRREPFGLSLAQHARIAWYWSSDKAAYEAAKHRAAVQPEGGPE